MRKSPDRERGCIDMSLRSILIASMMEFDFKSGVICEETSPACDVGS